MKGYWPRFVLALAMQGCVGLPAHPAAREVTVDQLVRVAEAGPGDQLYYIGTKGGFHFFESRHPSVAGPYKVAESALPHIDSFRIDGEPPYRMYAHVLEGKPLGALPSRTAEIEGN